jgi:hypothetical protein
LENHKYVIPVEIHSRVHAELPKRLCILIDELVGQLCIARWVTGFGAREEFRVDPRERGIIEQYRLSPSA